jgi:hypothetical protein
MEPRQQQRIAEEKSPRPKALRRIAITGGDIEILKFIHDYRLLRIRELELLTGRKYQRVHGRLKGLLDNGYLGRIELPWKKDIYYIARPGLSILLREGLITDEEADRRVREGELKDEVFLDHEMMLAGLHVMLTLVTRDSHIQLITWKEGKGIHDSFKVVHDGKYQEVSIQPDAFFTLRHTLRPEGKNTRSFLLEADRSTMPKKERPGSRRFNDKIRKYEHYIREGRPFKALGIPNIRILTVTLTRLRRDSLVRDAADILDETYRKYFLFGTLQDLSFEESATIFNPVFVRPGDAETRHELMP